MTLPAIPLSLIVSLARMQSGVPYSLKMPCTWPIETGFRIERGPRVNCSSVSASVLVAAARLTWGLPVDRYSLFRHQQWTIQTPDIWGPLTSARAMGMHSTCCHRECPDDECRRHRGVHLYQGWRDVTNLALGGHTWIEVHRPGGDTRIIDASPRVGVRVLVPRPSSWRWGSESSVRLNVDEEG